MSAWRIAVLAGLCALVTACGAGGDGGKEVASVSDKNAPAEEKKEQPKDPDEQMRAYAKCMREHGVDMPDPKPGEGGVVVGGGESGDPTFDKAQEACQDLAPGGGEMKPPTAAELDELRKQAKCLREHGLDVPDPTMEDPFITFQTDEQNNDKIDKAMEACSLGDMNAAPAPAGPTT